MHTETSMTGLELREKIEELITSSGFKIRSMTSNYSDNTIWIRNLEADNYEQATKQKCDSAYGNHSDRRHHGISDE